MSVKISQRRNGQILIIKQTVNWWISLIGAPFLIFGSYILSMFFYSIYCYLVNQASLLQWFKASLGLSLTLLFGLIFIAPGLYFVFGRLGQRIECDLNSRKIISYDSLLPWVKGKELNLDDYELIKVEYVGRKSKSRSSSTGSTSYRTDYYYELNLYGEEDRKLHLVSFLDSEEQQAIELARKIGRLFLIDIDDNPWEEKLQPVN